MRRIVIVMGNTAAKKTILIVEDDPFIAMDLEDTFSQNGYNIIGPCADVSTGLRLLKLVRPDVAMLDYNLGRETSIPLAKTLHKEKIPYVFLSGQVERVVTDHDLPVMQVIPKPFVPERLIDLIENLI